MNRDIHELFKAQLAKGSFEFDSTTKQTEHKPQFLTR